MLILEIALGIVLGDLLLRFLPEIIASGIVLVVGGIVIVIIGVALFLIYQVANISEVKAFLNFIFMIASWGVIGAILYMVIRHFRSIFKHWRSGFSHQITFPWLGFIAFVVFALFISLLYGSVLISVFMVSIAGGLVWLRWIEQNYSPFSNKPEEKAIGD